MQELIAPRPRRLASTPIIFPNSPSPNYGLALGHHHHHHVHHHPKPRAPTYPSLRVLSVPSDAFARISLADRPANSDESGVVVSDDSPMDEGDTSSSSTHSSCPSLPQETLEEFLAILRPSLNALSPPKSPNGLARTRRYNTTNSVLAGSGNYYERPHPYRHSRQSSKSQYPQKARSTSTTTSSSPANDEADRHVGPGLVLSASPSNIPGTSHDNNNNEVAGDPTEGGNELEVAWHPSSILLNSPISRTHTRNPLPRHPSYETLSSNLVFTFMQSPSPGPVSGLPATSSPGSVDASTLSPSTLPPLPPSPNANPTPVPQVKMDAC